MEIKVKEVVILVIVSLMALLANLPDEAVGHVLDKNLLLIALVTTVIISLFRYLRLMLFITVSVLAIGANLPDHLATQLGISQLVMIVASGVLVFVALMYKFYLVKFFDKQRVAIVADIDTRHEILTAIRDENAARLHKLLATGVEVNFSQDGQIPIFLAIKNGNPDILLLLLAHGAKLRIKNKDGLTPMDYSATQDERRARMNRLLRKSAGHYENKNGKLTAPEGDKMVIMFADICDSTHLYDKLGNESAFTIISAVLHLLVQEVATHQGTLIKTIGDEIMCSFPNVTLATQAACAMHFSLDARQPGGMLPVSVRIGFHYGEVLLKDNDAFGDAVNIAARLTSVTRAKQIITSQTVIDLLPSAYAEKVRPVMRAAFKGKHDSFPLFQILWAHENTVFNRIGEAKSRKKSTVLPQPQPAGI